MGTHSEAQLDTKFIDFMKQLNLYLNHFPKFEKYGLCQQIRNCAYAVYGYVIEAQKRYQKKTSLTNLDIAHEQLRMFLVLSRFTLHKVKRGLNFVGYRTWRSTRFVRKHSLYSFTKAAKKCAFESIVSILGHAKHTASFTHLLNTLKARHHALFNRLPSRLIRKHGSFAQTA